MIQSKNKFLIIRFSSFGDVVQALSIPTKLKELSPSSEIHWITRSDMAPLLQGHPHIDRIIPLERNLGFFGLLRLIFALKKERYSHIFDAHNNLRSHVISFLVRPPLALSRIFEPPHFIRKSQKRRKRFLLFRLKINRYRQPFSGQRDLLEPLKAWGLSEELPPPPQIFIAPDSITKIKSLLEDKKFKGPFIALAPSAAFILKRWPLEHWKKLVQILPDYKFICLGGPDDLFIQEIAEIDPMRILNLAGKISLQESSAVVSLSQALVTNDTGLLHVAEQLGKQAFAFMGPAPFGFPSRKSTQVLEINLYCRPCSKHGQGPCVNKEKYQKCLVDIEPSKVADLIKKMSVLSEHS